MKVIRLKSDNFEGLVTKEAYKYITLTMSSGDFGSHTKKIVEVKSLRDVTTLEQLQNEEEEQALYKCPVCGRP